MWVSPFLTSVEVGLSAFSAKESFKKNVSSALQSHAGFRSGEFFSIILSTIVVGLLNLEIL